MTRKNEIRIKRQTETTLSVATVIATLLVAIFFLTPNLAFAKVGDACKTDADCVVVSGAPAEVCDISSSKCVLKPATVPPVVPPPASPAKKFTCSDIVFSTGSDDYGCTVAAALDWSMPRTVETVEAKVGKMTKKQLDAYNAKLESMVRREVWKTFDYLVARGQLFGVKDPADKTYKVAPMTGAELRAFMQEDAQRLDVMAVGRHPKGPKGDTGDTGPQGDPGPSGACPTCPDPTKSGPVQ